MTPTPRAESARLRPGPPALALAVVAVALILAACGGDNASPVTVPTTATTVARTTTTRPATTASPSTTAGATTTVPASTTATTAATSSAPPTTANSTRCHTNELTLSLGPPDIAAGNVYVPVVLHNSSSRTCDVAGYPGVSLLDAAGAAIGTPTREPGAPVATVHLTPGATASTAIHTVNQGIAPGGCWPASAKVRVFPPNELNALDVAGAVTVCGNMFSVTPLVAGASGR